MTSTAITIALIVVGCILMFAMALRARRMNHNVRVVAATLGQGDAPPDMRQMKMSLPWTDRVLRPLLQQLYTLSRNLIPAHNVEGLQKNLIVAGLPGNLSVTDFLGLRFLAAATLGVMVFAFFIISTPFLTTLMYTVGGFAVGLFLPNFWLRSKIKNRQNVIVRALPDALDMMSICVDAGLGFEAAIHRVAYQWDNDLAQEFRRVISEIRVGVPRSDALRHLAERTDVQEISSFVGILIQADKLGIAVRDVLHSQAEQMRVRRRQRAEEEARKAPVKMMIPMVLFILPALFSIILGPAVPKLMEAFG